MNNFLRIHFKLVCISNSDFKQMFLRFKILLPKSDWKSTQISFLSIKKKLFFIKLFLVQKHTFLYFKICYTYMFIKLFLFQNMLYLCSWNYSFFKTCCICFHGSIPFSKHVSCIKFYAPSICLMLSFVEFTLIFFIFEQTFN